MDKRDTEDVFREALGDLCEPIMTCSVEVTSSSYRTYDGSCNNLKNARWGTSHRRQRRTVPQTYADGEFASLNTLPGLTICNKTYTYLFQSLENFISDTGVRVHVYTI